MSFFDSHAHLGAPELLERSDAIMKRAHDAGLIGIIAVGSGYGLEGNADAIGVAESHPDVWATAGMHPHDASLWNPAAEAATQAWLSHERVVAVGECGLDYYYEHSPREVQAQCLRAQIRLAHRCQLPLVIHTRPSAGSRDAFEDLLRIFDEEGAERAGGVMHCFTGDREFAEDCLERGFDISFSGILTFSTAGDLREVARALPLDRLLIETDSPFLAPVPHRGKPNEPAYVVRVAECLAELHATSLEQVATGTGRRTQHAFGIGNAA